jgi:hypothetical protein
VTADDRSQALQEIVTLARRHGVSAPEIAAALGERVPEGRGLRGRAVLVRVLGVLGGTFVFAGIAVFIGLQWSAMNSGARVIATLGSGIAAFVLALVASHDPRFDKAATPLFLIAAALETTGMLVTFDEYGSGGDWRVAALITALTMMLQFGATFGNLRASTPLFMTVLFGTLFWWTALDLLEVDGSHIALVIGASLLLASVGIDRTPHRGVTPLWYFLGGAAFLGGFFDLVERTRFEMLFVAVAAGFVLLSIVVHSRTLLFVATLGILAYTAWFTGQYFVDSVGWPLALIAFGVLMIGLSALAFRIDRQYVRAG